MSTWSALPRDRTELLGARRCRAGTRGIQLAAGRAALYYCNGMREEETRFAIGTHRAQRIKAIGKSRLEEVSPGIGRHAQRALLHYFGSAKGECGGRDGRVTRTPGLNHRSPKK